MSRRTRWISLIAGAAAFLAVASTAMAGMAGLTTTIEAQKSALGAADDAVVRITYRNDSPADLYLVRWQTALQGSRGTCSRCRWTASRSSTPAASTSGPCRGPRTTCASGRGAVSADVELSSVYDLSRTGEYSIRYRVALQDALRADSAKSVGAVAPRTLESNVVFLAVERDERGVAAVETLARLEELGRPDKALTPSYVSCSTTRQGQLVTALNNAQGLAQRSRDYLNAVPTASRSTDPNYKTWFGTYSSGNWSSVTGDYVNIFSAMSTQAFVFYCDCTDSSYAFVYANQPYKVHLCGAFWSAPATAPTPRPAR